MKNKKNLILLFSSTLFLACNDKKVDVPQQVGPSSFLVKHVGKINAESFETAGLAIKKFGGFKVGAITPTATFGEQYAFEDQNFDDISQLLGLVVEVKQDATTNQISINPLWGESVMPDTVKVKSSIPKNPATYTNYVSKGHETNLSALLNLVLEDNKTYDLKESTVAFSSIPNPQKNIGFQKVKDEHLCVADKPCNYYYVYATSLQVIESTAFSEKGRRIKVSDLNGIPIVKVLSGSFITADSTKDYNKYTKTFLTLVKTHK